MSQSNLARTPIHPPHPLQTQLNRLWTQNDLADKFGVTGMTIHLWRNNRGLPTIVIPGKARDAVRFAPEEVRRWARENNVKMRPGA